MFSDRVECVYALCLHVFNSCGKHGVYSSGYLVEGDCLTLECITYRITTVYNAVYGDDNKRTTSAFRVNATRNYLCITPHIYDAL